MPIFFASILSIVTCSLAQHFSPPRSYEALLQSPIDPNITTSYAELEHGTYTTALSSEDQHNERIDLPIPALELYQQNCSIRLIFEVFEARISPNTAPSIRNTSFIAAKTAWNFWQRFLSVFPEYDPGQRSIYGSIPTKDVQLSAGSHGDQYSPVLSDSFEDQNGRRCSGHIPAYATIQINPLLLSIQNYAFLKYLNQTDALRLIGLQVNFTECSSVVYAVLRRCETYRSGSYYCSLTSGSRRCDAWYTDTKVWRSSCTRHSSGLNL